MTTAFSSIVNAILVRLAEAPAVCDTLWRARSAPIPEQARHAVNVKFEAAFPARDTIEGAPVDWQSRIFVECFSAAVRDTGDAAVDDLFQKVYERLAADPTLSGLVDDIGTPSIEADNSDEGVRTGWVRLTYVVQHRTANDNLN